MTNSDNTGPGRDHNQKGQISDVCLSFVQAQGDLEPRRELKNQLKQLCTEFSLAWDKVCQWFREVVRAFETRKRAELKSRPMFCFTERV